MLLRGKPAWSVEMFAVLLVLTLVPTLSDGLLLKKCDLKSQLERALPDLQGKNNEEMIAKLVCTLGHISGFNTSLVTIIDQFNNRLFLQGNDEEYSSEIEEFPLTFISDQDTALPEDYNGQVRKRSDAPSMDGGDGSGEASIDQSEENKGVDHGPTDLPPDTTVKPTDTIYYDTFEMLFGFTTSPPETTEEPTDPIYYDDFDMLYGFTNSPPDTSEEHVDYYDDQVRKRRDAPSMDGGDGSVEASIDQSEENKGVENALQLDTIEPLESDVKQRSKRNAKAQTTFYGIFQLSDIACESGSSPSQNLCGLSCSALTDDDISDDIACLRDLLNSKIEKIFTQECLSVDPSVYFTTCG